METWQLLLVVAAVFIAAYLIYQHYYKGEKRGGTGMGNSSAGPTLYYRPGCPHCDNFKADWAKVKAAIGGTEVNCAEQSDLCQSQGISGVPTIKKGSATFDGNRTVENIIEWSKSVGA